MTKPWVAISFCFPEEHKLTVVASKFSEQISVALNYLSDSYILSLQLIIRTGLPLTLSFPITLTSSLI